MYIGSHVSIRNGYEQAAKKAFSIGATAFQYFPKNPRSLTVKDFSQQSAQGCANFCKEKSIVSIAHTPYPTKLIPEAGESEAQIVASLLNDLEIAEACRSIGIVVHFGTMKGEPTLDGYRKMITILNEVLNSWHGKSLLLIENNAGAGTNMGITLEEMVQVRKLTSNPEKIGFCFDTCHAFASGLWTGENWDEVAQKGRELGYFEHLKAVHLNNSKYPSGKRKDRHANLKDGHISQEQLESFLTSDVIKGIPLILETPDDEKYTHQEEIQLVKNWIM
ncbi:deoxyribonuclease IV [Anaerobacillus alkaliphilus]|uniref:Deoxyribonuclease IV n=1 Tax=Anaerobacillus alkaliphilus TaxID=1548597 RepID=A0A4Q0VXH1_9BACI|nr:deoxyribonuclease IV [Anaerobacillus alkaliphilus]RXJ04160.1 deoxyribonuclease IV [Anaerobacillus alkaliphilus]